MEIKKMINKAKRGLAVVVGTLMLSINSAMAEGIDDVIRPMTNLQTLLSTVAAGMGGVWLLWSLIQFAFAINQNDSGGKQSALKGIVAGGILLSAGVVLTFLQS